MSTFMDRQQELRVVQTIDTYWPHYPKMQKLAGRLRGPDALVHIKVMPANAYAEGWAAEFSDKIIISQEAVNDGDVATALAAFAEYQHTEDGGGLGEQDAQDEFILVRSMLPEDKRTDYIDRLHHAGTTNPIEE
jgi:hypothetical protein